MYIYQPATYKYMNTRCKYFRWSFWIAVELVHQKTQSRNLVTGKFVRKRKVARVACSSENFYRQCIGSRKVFPGTYNTNLNVNHTRTFYLYNLIYAQIIYNALQIFLCTYLHIIIQYSTLCTRTHILSHHSHQTFFNGVSTVNGLHLMVAKKLPLSCSPLILISTVSGIARACPSVPIYDASGRKLRISEKLYKIVFLKIRWGFQSLSKALARFPTATVLTYNGVGTFNNIFYFG